MNALAAAESRADLVTLRENVAAWAEPHTLSRALVAACDEAIQLLDAGKYEQARGAVTVIFAAVKAAGPRAWGAGVAR